jgi:hypothetical protein
MALMNQREDHGVEIVESMTEKEIDALGQIIPQMVSGPSPLSDIEKHQREEIFRTFARFFSVLAGKLPLVILIDDLHYADPASLHLIRVIIRTNLLRLFICGTAGEENQTRPEAVPLALFRIRLRHGTGSADHYAVAPDGGACGKIHQHDLSWAFHASSADPGTDRNDPGKSSVYGRNAAKDDSGSEDSQLKGRVWHMARLEKRYFPRTLEEIIQQKMNSLDEESKRFLECASAFGESISLSMLTGSYSEKSSRIHDFLNQGMAHGTRYVPV